jgi:hypothetical protein
VRRQLKFAGEGGYLILKHRKTTDVLGPTLLIDRRYWFSSLRLTAAGVHSLNYAAVPSQLLSFRRRTWNRIGFNS